MTGPGSQARLWRVKPNPLRRSSEWWDHARASAGAPEVMRPLLTEMPADEISVNDAEAAAIRRWAANLPDWEAAGANPEPPLIIE